ncbi:unnamed protein product, partial [Staurois parvus]
PTRAPFAAVAVNHRVPPGDSPLVPSDYLRRGGGLLCLLTVLLSVGSGTLLWMASSVLTVKHQHTTPQ